MVVGTRTDTWQNLLSGLGTARDKATYGHFQASHGTLSSEALEALFVEDDIAARICELLPSEMLRRGLAVKTGDESIDALIKDSLEGLELTKKLTDALIWSRVYGGAALFIGVDDGVDTAKPVNHTKIRALRFLRVLTCRELKIHSRYEDPLEANFGSPKTFHIEAINSNGNFVEIHESRLLVFHGTRTPQQIKERNNGWSLSVLQRVYTVMQQVNLSWQTAAHLMSDAAQAVFKLKGLHSAIASNQTDELLKRMELVDMSRSVSRSVLLDADDEDFKRDSYNFAGIPELLDKFMLRLAAAARVPVSLLMGQAPAGLQATGASDIRFFYDEVQGEQESLKPNIRKIVNLLMASQNKNVAFDVEFPSLWQESEREKAEVEKMRAETDAIYIQEGVLLPEEVSLKRFNQAALMKSGGEARTEILEDEVEKWQ